MGRLGAGAGATQPAGHVGCLAQEPWLCRQIPAQGLAPALTLACCSLCPPQPSARGCRAGPAEALHKWERCGHPIQPGQWGARDGGRAVGQQPHGRAGGQRMGGGAATGRLRRAQSTPILRRQFSRCALICFFMIRQAAATSRAVPLPASLACMQRSPMQHAATGPGDAPAADP